MFLFQKFGCLLGVNCMLSYGYMASLIVFDSKFILNLPRLNKELAKSMGVLRVCKIKISERGGIWKMTGTSGFSCPD